MACRTIAKSQKKILRQFLDIFDSKELNFQSRPTKKKTGWRDLSRMEALAKFKKKIQKKM